MQECRQVLKVGDLSRAVTNKFKWPRSYSDSGGPKPKKKMNGPTD